jgi:catabolite regulation protein CreA
MGRMKEGLPSSASSRDSEGEKEWKKDQPLYYQSLLVKKVYEEDVKVFFFLAIHPA